MVDSSIFPLLVRLAFSLAIVIGLMMLLAAALRKRGVAVGHSSKKTASGRNSPATQVEVVARRGLGRNAQVAIVRAGGRTMVLGVTDHQVTMLGDAELYVNDIEDIPTGVQRTDLPGSADGPSGSPWTMMLETMRAKTVRR